MNPVITQAAHALRPAAAMNVIPFPAPCALLDGEGYFTQSDEDFLADLGVASNDPHMEPHGQRAFRSV